MDKSTASKIAEQYLKDSGTVYAICLGERVVPDAEVDSWIQVLRALGDVFPGTPRRLWRFDFLREDLPDDVICTGNQMAVFVDDATGTCGLYGFM